jgi:APA family basic amino acid/polyamine antiporter
VPALWVIGPLTIFGCIFLFFNLPVSAMLLLPIWIGSGIVVYFSYGRSHCHVGLGMVEVHELEYADFEPDIPGFEDRGRL